MIQIDIDMPKTCGDCPFHIYHSDKNYVCVATPLFYPMNLANYKGGRKDFCPLKEVPQEPVLDKLRAEMKPYTDPKGFIVIGENRFNMILDRCKAESEE